MQAHVPECVISDKNVHCSSRAKIAPSVLNPPLEHALSRLWSDASKCLNHRESRVSQQFLAVGCESDVDIFTKVEPAKIRPFPLLRDVLDDIVHAPKFVGIEFLEMPVCVSQIDRIKRVNEHFLCLSAHLMRDGFRYVHRPL